MTPARNPRGGPRLLCVYQHAPTPGAPGIYRHRLYFAELVRRGWSVDLVSTAVNYMTGDVPPRYARRPYVREEIDGVVHHWVWAPSRIHRSRGRRAANYLAFAAAAGLRGASLPRPDVILASSPPLPVATLGEALSRRYRRPWVLEVRDIWPESAVAVGWLAEGSRAYRLLERVAHHHSRRASAVIVPTPGLVDGVRSHGAADVHVVSGAVVDAPPDDEARRATRQELGVADDKLLVVYVGAIGVANGVETVVDALAQLPPETRVEVVVAGDGSARALLEARLRAAPDLPMRLLPAVPKERVHRLLAASDVCLHTLRPDSVFEAALPNKVLESLAARRPFITNVPGLPEELARATGGAYAPTTADLAAELARWAAMPPEERRRRGEAGHRYAVAHFGLEQAVDALESLLLACIGGAHERPRTVVTTASK